LAGYGRLLRTNQGTPSAKQSWLAPRHANSGHVRSGSYTPPQMLRTQSRSSRPDHDDPNCTYSGRYPVSRMALRLFEFTISVTHVAIMARAKFPPFSHPNQDRPNVFQTRRYQLGSSQVLMIRQLQRLHSGYSDPPQKPTLTLFALQGRLACAEVRDRRRVQSHPAARVTRAMQSWLEPRLLT
jgi:hypothetical protein